VRFLAILVCTALFTQAFAQKAASSTVAKPAKSLFPVLLKKNVPLGIEVADNDSLRQKGLSGRRTLDWDQGMLFVFPNSAPRSFWMIDCHFDIDVAYLNRDGIVRDVVSMHIQPGVPMDQLQQYPSLTGDISYALETNRGWFDAHEIKPGDTLRSLTRWKTSR
jgi:uncharacterized protein